MEQNELILRDILAIDRTVLANQRTLLAYIKLGILLESTAVGTYYLAKKEVFGMVEWLLSGFGMLAIVLGFTVYFRMRKKINALYK
jgi:putative membrane protein